MFKVNNRDTRIRTVNDNDKVKNKDTVDVLVSLLFTLNAFYILLLVISVSISTYGETK